LDTRAFQSGDPLQHEKEALPDIGTHVLDARRHLREAAAGAGADERGSAGGKRQDLTPLLLSSRVPPAMMARRRAYVER
jgi:hypothetical protein